MQGTRYLFYRPFTCGIISYRIRTRISSLYVSQGSPCTYLPLFLIHPCTTYLFIPVLDVSYTPFPPNTLIVLNNLPLYILIVIDLSSFTSLYLYFLFIAWLLIRCSYCVCWYLLQHSMACLSLGTLFSPSPPYTVHPFPYPVHKPTNQNPRPPGLLAHA